MKLFKFKTLKMKIIVSFLLVVLAIALYSNYSLQNSSNIRNQITSIVKTELKLEIANEQAASNFTLKQSVIRAYVLTGDEEYLTIFKETHKKMTANKETIDSLTDSTKADELQKQTLQWYGSIEKDVIAVYQNGNKKDAQSNLIALDTLGKEIRTGYVSLAEETSKNITKTGADLVILTKSNLNWGLALSIFIMILSIAIAYFTARSISKPINLVTNRLTELAGGDLSQDNVVVSTKDEIGRLGIQTNILNDKLHTTISSVQSISNDVAINSTELATASDDIQEGAKQVSITMQELADGSDEQATHASNLASTIDDFVQTVRVSNKKGTDVYNNSTEVLTHTSIGSDLMKKSNVQMQKIDVIMNNAVSKMQNLSKESEQITMLVQVIDNIANQTNLLALNAAIEAARAGESGKGFAVVADEVRKLAEQVTNSVTDISIIVKQIQESTTHVSTSLENGYEEVIRGTEQIEETNKTFTTIHNAVSKMAEGVQSISADLENIEKSSSTVQISVDEIASVSQQSAAGVEETTATIQQTLSSIDQISANSADLANMARKLNDLTNQFST